MNTTDTTTEAPIFGKADVEHHTDTLRLGWILSKIRHLPDSEVRDDILASIDYLEAEIIKAAHHHGVELDEMSRAAMLRLLSADEAHTQIAAVSA